MTVSDANARCPIVTWFCSAPARKGTCRGRHVHVVVAGIFRKVRQHAHNRVRTIVHLEHATNHFGIGAKFLNPVPVAEEQHRLRAKVIVCGEERAAVQRAYAEHVEEAGVHDARVDAVRLPLIEERERHAVVLDQVVHQRRPLAIAVELRDRDADVRKATGFRLMLDEHQLVAVGERQRLEQHTVQHGEHRGVGADAERENESRGGGVAGRSSQGAQAKLQVLTKHLEKRHSSHVVYLLARLRYTPKPSSCLTLRFVWRQSRLTSRLGFHLEVERNLARNLIVHAPRPQQRPHTLPESAERHLRHRHHARDGGGDALPVGGFGLQLFLARAGQAVELCLPVRVGHSPVGGDPALQFKSVQCRIQRALVDLENIFRHLLDALSDGPAVLGAQRQRPQDQHVEGALQQIGACGSSHDGLCRRSTRGFGSRVDIRHVCARGAGRAANPPI